MNKAHDTTANFEKSNTLQDQADKLFTTSRVPVKHIIVCGFDEAGNVLIRMAGLDYVMLPTWAPGKPINCTTWVRGQMQGGLPA